MRTMPVLWLVTNEGRPEGEMIFVGCTVRSVAALYEVQAKSEHIVRTVSVTLSAPCLRDRVSGAGGLSRD